MTEDFNNKLADALWTLLEPRIQKLIDGSDGGDIDDKIEQWMRYHFDLSDYSLDITDYSHEIDGMVDAQVQYLAEDGDLKEWLGNREDNDTEFRQRVYAALNDYYDIRLVRKIDG
jgi:hypothetical protein